MADSPYITDVTSENFSQVVLQGSAERLVLVDFWAEWCAPCKMLLPVLAKLADEMQGQLILAKINTDQQQALAQEYAVRSLPTVKFFRNGAVVNEFMGAQSEAHIRQMLDQHIVRPSDHLLAQAMQLQTEGNHDAALALLKQANEDDPGRPKIIVALAGLLTETNDLAGAENLLNSLSGSEKGQPEVAALMAKLEFARQSENQPDVDSLLQAVKQDENNLEARFQLASQAITAEDYETGLEQLLEIMKRDRGYKDDIGRKTLLKVFDMLGDNPLAADYRRKMFNLLY